MVFEDSPVFISTAWLNFSTLPQEEKLNLREALRNRKRTPVIWLNVSKVLFHSSTRRDRLDGWFGASVIHYIQTIGSVSVFFSFLFSCHSRKKLLKLNFKKHCESMRSSRKETFQLIFFFLLFLFLNLEKSHNLKKGRKAFNWYDKHSH